VVKAFKARRSMSKMHEHETHTVKPVLFGIIITSDKVFEGKRIDTLTSLIEGKILEKGHKVIYKTIVPNNESLLMKALKKACRKGCHTVLITGGTGLSPRDISVDTLEKVAYRRIPGFGELFRYLTFLKHGSLAWLSRASAYVVSINNKTCLVFVMPGSIDAVQLALDQVILPEISHAVGELLRK